MQLAVLMKHYMYLMFVDTSDPAMAARTSCHQPLMTPNDVVSCLPNPQVKPEDDKKSVLSRSTSFRDVTSTERHLVEKRRSDCEPTKVDLSEEDDKLQRILKQRQKQQEFQERMKKQLQHQRVSKEMVAMESPSTGHLSRKFKGFILCFSRIPRGQFLYLILFYISYCKI